MPAMRSWSDSPGPTAPTPSVPPCPGTRAHCAHEMHKILSLVTGAAAHGPTSRSKGRLHVSHLLSIDPKLARKRRKAGPPAASSASPSNYGWIVTPAAGPPRDVATTLNYSRVISSCFAQHRHNALHVAVA